MNPEELSQALKTPDKQRRLALIKAALPQASVPALKILLAETARHRTGNALQAVLQSVAKAPDKALQETLLSIYDRTQPNEKKTLLSILHQMGFFNALLERIPDYSAVQLLNYAERLNEAQLKNLFSLSPEALRAALDFHLRIWLRRKGKN